MGLTNSNGPEMMHIDITQNKTLFNLSYQQPIVMSTIIRHIIYPPVIAHSAIIQLCDFVIDPKKYLENKAYAVNTPIYITKQSITLFSLLVFVLLTTRNITTKIIISRNTLFITIPEYIASL